MTDKEVIETLACCVTDSCAICKLNRSGCVDQLIKESYKLVSFQTDMIEALIKGQESLQAYIKVLKGGAE